MYLKEKIIFICFALLFCASTFWGNYPFSWLLKIMPMVMLMVLVWQQPLFPVKKALLLGLLFSTCGDFFLDFNPDGWFILGLASFFLAHCCYLFSLKPLQNKHRVFVLAYLVFGTSILVLLAPNLGDLFMPVLAYMMVLLTLAIGTLLSAKTNNYLIAGGLSFVISDSLLGINRFYAAINHADFYIMVSYYVAQFALVCGFIQADNRSDDTERWPCSKSNNKIPTSLKTNEQ